MSRRLLTLIVLAGVLVLAIVAFLVVTNLPERAAQTPVSGRVEVDQFDVGSIRKIVLSSDQRTLTLEKKDGVWTVDGRNRPDLEAARLEDIAYSFSSLWAELMVEENPADLSVYGLDKPQQVATAYLADGSTRTYLLGDKTPAGNTYYLMPQGGTRVYAVWMNHGNNLSATVDSLRSLAMPTIDPQALRYVYLSRSGQRPLEIGLVPVGTPPSVYVFGAWQVLKPYGQPHGINSDKLTELQNQISFSQVKGLVEEEARDLGRYGLEPPQAEIVLKDETATLHLLVGNELDQYTTYFRYPDSRTVYTIDSYQLSMLDTSAFAMTDKFAFITNIDGVDQIVLEHRDSGRHTVDIKRDGKDENGQWKSTFSVDGKVIEDKAFRTFYQAIIGVIVDGEAQGGREGSRVAAFTYRLAPNVENQRGAMTVTLEFLDYSPDFYLVRRDGVADFVTAKGRDVETVFTSMEELLRQ